MSTEAPEVTADVIRELAQAEAVQFNQWIDSEDDSPPAEYWVAFDAWLNGYDRHLLPIAWQEMETLAREHAAWDASGLDEPTSSFWVARQFANEACQKTPPVLERMKLPAELVAEKVSHRQIARIWHLLQPDGEPDIARVEAELAAPGTVITPEHIALMDQRRLAALGFAADPDWKDEPEPQLPAREIPNINRLIEDRGNVDQIARAMADHYGTPIGRWHEVVPALAAAMGVKLAQNASQTVNEGGQSVSEKKFGEDFVRRGQNIQPTVEPTEVTLGEADDEPAPADPVDVGTRIIELFEAGHDVTAICREVGMPAKKVRAEIRKWEKSMQADGVDGAGEQDAGEEQS